MKQPSSNNVNAWLVSLPEWQPSTQYYVTLEQRSTYSHSIEEGDGLLLTDGTMALAFARVYRINVGLTKTTIFFDSLKEVTDRHTLADIGLIVPPTQAPVLRMDWPIFEAALKSLFSIEFKDFPTLSGESVVEQAYIRELLQEAVKADILGPADGPYEEILGMSVRDRYLVGKLAPVSDSGDMTAPAPLSDDDVPDGEIPDDLIPYGNEDHISNEETSASTIDDDEEQEINAANNQSLVPSSMGFTFCVDCAQKSIQLIATWGRYERADSDHQLSEKTGKPKRCWKRIPSGGIITLSLEDKIIKPTRVDSECPNVFIQGSVSILGKNEKLVTIFLVNTQRRPPKNQDYAWIFQPELSVRDVENRPIFQRRPILRADEFDDEREALEMIYRHQVEFAVGHGVSIHAEVSADDPEKAGLIKTVVLPEYELPVTETPGLNPEDRPAMRKLIEDGLLDMELLAGLDRDDLIGGLRILADDYAAWISETRSRGGIILGGYNGAGAVAMERCALILERLNEGIEVLRDDDHALAAFRFANRAMALQRIRSIYAKLKHRGEDTTEAALNVRENRSWRPFQLAFVLLTIPALANPTHRDRTKPLEAFADLLWFPTGGGKTEAYLGVAAFTMGIRRLQGNLGGLDGGRGLAVIMRYTLRLLTLQQFHRATALICALEVIRRAEPEIWGNEPFSLGLWVGQRVTPNTTEESHEAIDKERDGKPGTGSSPAQLTSCPWCGSEINPGRDIIVDREARRTLIFCSDKYGRCDFSKANAPQQGLPVLVVDEEIYRRPPSMLIATVDKFAMMAWRGPVRTLFGKARQECLRHGLLWPEAECTGNHPAKKSFPSVKVQEIKPIRPPDLIIQDEFHLISGPLGTMVGLYETAVDELSSWALDGQVVRPKIIASTATVRKAEEQMNNVFLRKVSIFPPHGLEAGDNFFSVQRSMADKPGRLYMGICSPGSSRPAVLIRVYVALLTAAQALFEHFGPMADPYMTVVGYFNSLRELGGMRRLAEDDVQTRSYRVQMGEVRRPGLSQRSVRNVDELTSRVSNKDIPKKLDRLEVKFKPKWSKGELRALDLVLATNMLSVGVDVNRLGLMVVNGQPKNTAEYIQATSRVGRFFPGLICTVLTWARPRDLSHYETFEHYHACFYKHVEAQSVTPFAPRALDRGLTGTLVSMLRLENEALNPNRGAQSLDNATRPEAMKSSKAISDRAWKVKDKTAKTLAEAMAADRIDRWIKEAIRPGRSLGYETKAKQGDLVALLKKPGALAWDELTVPMSMREVEPGVRLIMDAANLSSPPDWQAKVVQPSNNNGDES